MITRRQWDLFCKSVNKALHAEYGFPNVKVHIKGNQVYKIVGHKIYTLTNGKEKEYTTYCHPGSLTNNTKILELYRETLVSFAPLALNDLIKLRRKKKHAEVHQIPGTDGLPA
jgi:hypothetical protein